MALLNLLLLLVLQICAAVKSEVELQKRVYNGQLCTNNERLYHVKLKASNPTHEKLCGGSLISDQWVLTAAHCWEDGPGWVHTAVVGVHPDPAKGETMTITHKEIYVDENNNQHDIMLLKLPKKTTIKPVGLPDCSNPIQVKNEVQIAGLAATTAGPNGAQIIDFSPRPLHCAKFKVKTINQVMAYGHMFEVEGIQVDTCVGDSGGGAIHSDMIYGVHVRGGANTVCTTPAVEMDVCKYMKWIMKIIKPKCSSFSCFG